MLVFRKVKWTFHSLMSTFNLIMFSPRSDDQTCMYKSIIHDRILIIKTINNIYAN